MAPLKFIFFIFAFSLFSRSSHAAKAGQPTDTASVAETAPVNCLNAFNAPRTLAGLPLFVEKSTMTGHSVESLCDRAQQGTGGFYEAGTFFYAHQTGEEQDCAAAVAYWRGGLAAVKNQLPPAYTKDSDVYKNEQFLGLVGLFNPKENAAVECQYVKCPVTATTTPAPTAKPDTELSPPGPSVPGASGDGGQESGVPGAVVNGQGDSEQPQQENQVSEQGSTEVGGGAKAKALTPPASGAPRATPDAVAASSSAAPAPPQVSELEVKPETAQEGAAAGSAAPSAPGVSAKPEPSDASPPLPEKARRLEAAKSTYNALVCMTTPAVLVEKQQPFTQGQWEKILGATSASTAATVPAFSLLALTALAIYMN